MEHRDNIHSEAQSKKWKLFGFILAIILVITYFMWPTLNSLSNKKPEQVIADKSVAHDEIIDGIHLRTGLKEGEGMMTVVTHCTACHSAQLIIQNRMNKERWNATIRWMQETQNLWDLGDNQEVIVNYLVKNYPVYNKGRRENIQDIQWYELSD